MRNDFTFLNAQNSHRNIKEAQFQMSIKPGSWMLFRREEETQRHNLIPMAIDEVGFKAQNSHRNIKEAQFQMSIKPGSWMLFRREEETQRHPI
ncbi:uncharacterized protein LOC136034025 isoform X4 [Artemia franciscana]|uniref:uncharacterized protein LOC136034025 isoform X4 n=1 Tax=Artemia franciscana TaxID=6661 RepID=UPI0032DBC7E0